MASTVLHVITVTELSTVRCDGVARRDGVQRPLAPAGAIGPGIERITVSCRIQAAQLTPQGADSHGGVTTGRPSRTDTQRGQSPTPRCQRLKL